MKNLMTWLWGEIPEVTEPTPIEATPFVEYLAPEYAELMGITE